MDSESTKDNQGNPAQPGDVIELRVFSDLTLARILAVVVTAAITLNACWISHFARTHSTQAAAQKPDPSSHETEQQSGAAQSTGAGQSKLRSLNIIELMPKMFNLFLGPLAALFFIGMFLPHCSAKSAVPAVLAGVLISVVWNWWQQLFGTDWSPTFTLGIAVPCVGTLFLAAVLGIIVEGTRPKDKGYSWWAVMRRASDEQSRT